MLIDNRYPRSVGFSIQSSQVQKDVLISLFAECVVFILIFVEHVVCVAFIFTKFVILLCAWILFVFFELNL